MLLVVGEVTTRSLTTSLAGTALIPNARGPSLIPYLLTIHSFPDQWTLRIKKIALKNGMNEPSGCMSDASSQTVQRENVKQPRTTPLN